MDDSVSRAELAVAESLRQLLDRTSIGAELWDSDYDDHDSRELLSSLEFYLPEVLGTVHPFWIGESLDGFRTILRKKTADRTAEIFGLAILISDQRWTPFELELRVSASKDEVEWLRCRISASGSGTGGIAREYAWGDGDKATRGLSEHRKGIDWAFGVSFDETPGD